MSWKKIIAIIILLIFIAGVLFVAYEYQTTTTEENVLKGDHNVLLLCADPSEKRPGIGAVDMAFIIHTYDGNIKNVTPVYPGHMAHPTASPPQYLKDSQGVNKLYLHDALWDANVETGTKLAQEIVQYNTGLKTDIVVVVTPDAIDAMIKAIGPIYVNGTDVTGSSIAFVRNEQYNENMTRGNAVESVMKPMMNAIKDKNKYSALLQVAAVQYAKGNIVVVPKDVFFKIAIANGLQSLL
ncbi:MAG TPA: DUF4012 domain-containing protein [Methanobacterium sp.]|nr:DUF4012 domain-containing protein [Methanobacterium sp.]